MKRSLVILSFIFIFLLSLSIFSAQENVQNGKISFGKWLNKLFVKISGKTITGMQVSGCSDSDGFDINTKGNCADSSAGYVDSCYDSNTVKEYSCGKTGGCGSQTVACAAGYNCVDGACTQDSGEAPEVGGETSLFCKDADQDSYIPLTKGCPSPYDCNDNNANIKPGATEICGNNVDEDCNGADLSCSVLSCAANWTKVETACQADETSIAYYLNQTDCINARPQNKTINCDYNKNNLICESFSGIDSVGIGGYLLNASKNYTGTQLVQLAQPGGAGVDFNWNFENALNFCNISVEVAGSSDNFGYTIVNNAGTSNKTVWIERLNNSNQVCVKDIPGEILISDFSSRCNKNNEKLISCPSINSTYDCEIIYDEANANFSWFQVWPLNHSAVKEIYLSGLTTTETFCTENWNCAEFSDEINQCGTRTCIDLKNCGTTFTKPIENAPCISPELGCVSDWSCTNFGKCTDGFQERVCTDLNSCGDDTTKPTETQECKKKISLLIIAIAIFGLLLIIFLIWYFMMKKKSVKKFSGEHKAPVHAAPPSPPKHPSVSLPQSNVYTPRPQYPHARKI